MVSYPFPVAMEITIGKVTATFHPPHWPSRLTTASICLFLYTVYFSRLFFVVIQFDLFLILLLRALHWCTYTKPFMAWKLTKIETNFRRKAAENLSISEICIWLPKSLWATERTWWAGQQEREEKSFIFLPLFFQQDNIHIVGASTALLKWASLKSFNTLHN